MKKSEKTKLFKEIMKDYINSIFGFLIGASTVALAISRLKLLEILLAFFGFIMMVIDDWFLSREFLKMYPPKSNLSFLLNIFYIIPFIFMILSLALISSDIRWLTGYPLGFLFYLFMDEIVSIVSMKEYRGKLSKIIRYTNYVLILPTVALTYFTYNDLISAYLTLILIPVLYFIRRLMVAKYLEM